MLNRIKKKKKGLPEVSTSSLPDIVFMLLFFFMVTTVMRSEQDLVQITQPQASEAQKLTDNSVIGTIRIGQPNDRSYYGTADRIQLNDMIAHVDEVIDFTEEKIDQLPEEKKRLYTTSLKADQQAKMEIVTQVKQELRKANALKLQYSTDQKQ